MTIIFRKYYFGNINQYFCQYNYVIEKENCGYIDESIDDRYSLQYSRYINYSMVKKIYSIIDNKTTALLNINVSNSLLNWLSKEIISGETVKLIEMKEV